MPVMYSPNRWSDYPDEPVRERMPEMRKTQEQVPNRAVRTTHPRPLPVYDTEDFQRSKKREKHKEKVRHHWLSLASIGMLITLSIVFIGQIVMPWTTTVWDDFHYGRPRTFQTDAFVGHESNNTPSHFIALNLKGRVQVIEFPGGDPTHAHIFVGPQLGGTQAELAPITLKFVDIDSDHHPDMIVLFQNSQIVFHNEQGTFRSQ